MQAGVTACRRLVGGACFFRSIKIEAKASTSLAEVQRKGGNSLGSLIPDTQLKLTQYSADLHVPCCALRLWISQGGPYYHWVALLRRAKMNVFMSGAASSPQRSDVSNDCRPFCGPEERIDPKSDFRRKSALLSKGPASAGSIGGSSVHVTPC